MDNQKVIENTFQTVTFYVKMEVIDLHLYLKCHSFTGYFSYIFQVQTNNQVCQELENWPQIG